MNRVLGPGGLLILAVRMRRDEAGVFEPSRYGLTETQIDEVIAALNAVGFRDITSRRREIGRETIAAVIARR